MLSVSTTSPRESARPDAGLQGPPDPPKSLARLFRDLSSSPDGLSAREAARRLEVYGPNELARRGGSRWPGELTRQFTHPLALLLMLAAVLAWVSGTPRLGIAIAAVILLNAGFAFAQEMQPGDGQQRHPARYGRTLVSAARPAALRRRLAALCGRWPAGGR